MMLMKPLNYYFLILIAVALVLVACGLLRP